MLTQQKCTHDYNGNDNLRKQWTNLTTINTINIVLITLELQEATKWNETSSVGSRFAFDHHGPTTELNE